MSTAQLAEQISVVGAELHRMSELCGSSGVAAEVRDKLLGCVQSLEALVQRQQNLLESQTQLAGAPVRRDDAQNLDACGRTGGRPNQLGGQENWWQALVEFVPDVILTLGRDYTIQYINQYPTQAAKKALGMNAIDFVEPSQREMVQAAWESVLTAGTPTVYEVWATHVLSDRTRHWYEVHAGPLEYEGEIIGIILVARDITLQREAEDQLRSEHQLLGYLLEAHIRDRKLVAYELHDGLLQQLTGAQMHLDSMRQKPPLKGAVPAEYDHAIEILRCALDEGRRIMGSLQPVVMDEFGVPAGLRDLVRRSSLKGLTVHFDPPEDFPRFPGIVESTLYSIAAEAIDNIRRHAQTDEAWLTLVIENDQVHLEIRDNGVGFDTTTRTKSHFGLHVIRRRAEGLLGAYALTSAPGRGTTIAVKLPVVACLARRPEE